ncbi:30S ribosomal protein S21 [Devosia sp. 1635]|uniref:30S ribosomal protein S21 n=1 Tax=Devosia sp. 1635 TaxID=2726066 RepID=UPI0015659034|nr:30S ribosomal protein S21 [Devosia sp. 1635]
MPPGRQRALSPLVPFGEAATELGNHLQIQVRDNNVDQALKVLKKKLQREGVFREMKLRAYYEKPSEKRARQAGEAVRRVRKDARKQAIREGLIEGPKRKGPERIVAPSLVRGG